jgi:hypothetical protein
MAFGLCNAGATFQRLMDIVMSGLNMSVCLVYLDDIICYSVDIEQHLIRLASILHRLRSSGLKLKPEKCSFFQKEVSFLGHTISDLGIGTDPRKTATVSEWPVPQSVKDVRSFVGMTSYYRRFVKDYAKIASPLNAIARKNICFQWSDEAQNAFDKLKDAMTSAPILAMPTDDDDYTLDTDASDFAIGAVLSQKQNGIERVIAYASRSLDRREQNYCVTRRELLAIVHFLKYFKQYLLGRKFKVRTDHAALTWLRKTPDPIGQQARWLEQMEEFDFVVEHRPGTSHGNADAMSRRPCPKRECFCKDSQKLLVGPSDYAVLDKNKLSTLVEINEEIDDIQGIIQNRAVQNMIEIDPNVEKETDVVMSWSWDDLKLAQKQDKDIGCIVDWLSQKSEQPPWDWVALKSKDTKTLWYLWPRLEIRDGILRRRFDEMNAKSTSWQIVLPSIFRKEFLRIAHGGMTGGHLGKSKMKVSVQKRAFWPTWSSDVDLHIKTCEVCAKYHRGSAPHQVSLQTPLVGEPWERVSIDITGPHPKSSFGKQYILTLVDHFSKWAEAIPIANHTAQTVAKALMTNIFTKFGAPLQLLSDRGPEFESDLFSELMRIMEIDKLRTSAYKPSTNGTVERFHRTLNSMLGKVVSESQRDWDQKLPFVLAAYRASVHSSTGYSPNSLFLGREVRMPVDLVLGVPGQEKAEQKYDQYLRELCDKVESSYESARKHLQVAAQMRKRNYDVKVRTKSFEVGQWVWYYYPRRFQRKSPKWQKMYTGPYLIVKAIAPVNFAIQKSSHSKVIVVHADKLKRCFSATPESWLKNDHVQRLEHSQNECFSNISNDIAEVEHKENNDQLNLGNDDENQENEQIERSQRENRKKPKRFDDYVM